MRHLLLVFLVFLLVSCSGGGGEDAAVPRRTAFPRVPALSDSTVEFSVENLSFGLSADAVVSRPSGAWLDAFYPSLGATMHLSVNRTATPEAFEEAYDNRMQRISLNLGEASAEVSRFVGIGGFDCEMVVASDGVATPVQFIASGPEGVFVSGSFVMGGSVEPADSIRPVVDALQKQAFLLLNTLHLDR